MRRAGVGALALFMLAAVLLAGCEFSSYTQQSYPDVGGEVLDALPGGAEEYYSEDWVSAYGNNYGFSLDVPGAGTFYVEMEVTSGTASIKCAAPGGDVVFSKENPGTSLYGFKVEEAGRYDFTLTLDKVYGRFAIYFVAG